MGARGKREAFSKRLWKTPLHVCTCSQPFPKRLSRPEFPAFSTIAAASIGHALQHKSDPPKRQENHKNRGDAAGVYEKYKDPFLEKISGAESKELLIRGEDVQVLNGFSSKAKAEAYLKSDFFEKDIVRELTPLLEAPPEIRVYEAM